MKFCFLKGIFVLVIRRFISEQNVLSEIQF